MNEEFLGGFILAFTIIFMLIEFVLGHTLLAGLAAVLAGLTFGVVCFASSKKSGVED